MPHLRLLSSGIVFLLLASSVCYGQTQLNVGPYVGAHFGEIGYKSEGIFNRSLGVSLGSELIFPLDFAIVGLEAQYHVLKEGRRDWLFRLKGGIGVTDPGGKFTDRDWFAFPPGLETNWSYSESNVEGNSIHLELQAAKVITASTYLELSLFAGLGYQKFSQDAVDLLVGRFVGNVVDTFFFDSGSRTGLSLTYDVYFINPVLGLAPRLAISPSVTLSGQAAYTPLLYVNDEDNHVLRFFTVKSSGRGRGFFSELNLRVDVGPREGSNRPFFELFGGFSSVHADLGATVEFYDDEPSGDFKKGDRIINDPHVISGHQLQVEVKLGWPL